MPQSNKNQVKIYASEFINHAIINRGLLRLYDNIEGVYDNLFETITDRTTPTMAYDIAANSDAIASINSQYSAIIVSNNIVEENHYYWTWAYNMVHTKGEIWDAAAARNTLNSLNDVDFNSPAHGNILIYDNISKTFKVGVQFVETNNEAVNAIIEVADESNGWTENVTTVSGLIPHLHDAINYVDDMESMYSEFYNDKINPLFRDVVHVLNDDTYVDNYLSGDIIGKSNPFYAPYLSGEYALNEHKFKTHPLIDNSEIQTIKFLITTSSDLEIGYLPDLYNQDMTINGTLDGGTPSELYLKMNYFGNSVFPMSNFPGDVSFGAESKNALSVIDSCTFGFSNIDIDNSRTYFDGLSFTKNNIFDGTVDQKFYFSNCYIDLDEVTIDNDCTFIFNNSCTVVAGTTNHANLSIINTGIPTYINNPAIRTYNSFVGKYMYNNVLY